MKQFRIIVGSVATEWFNQADWTLGDMQQWAEFPDVEIEYRTI